MRWCQTHFDCFAVLGPEGEFQVSVVYVVSPVPTMKMFPEKKILLAPPNTAY